MKAASRIAIVAMMLLAVVFSTPVSAQDMSEKEFLQAKQDFKKATGLDFDKLTPIEIGAVMRGLDDGTPPEKALARRS